MAFKKIIPRSRSSYGDVKVSFTGSKTIYANVYLSYELLDKLGWGSDCRVYVYYDDEEPKKWMIEKSLANDSDSFRLASSKNGKNKISKLQFKFDEYKISEEEKKLKAVNYEILEGKIIIKNG